LEEMRRRREAGRGKTSEETEGFLERLQPVKTEGNNSLEWRSVSAAVLDIDIDIHAMLPELHEAGIVAYEPAPFS